MKKLIQVISAVLAAIASPDQAACLMGVQNPAVSARNARRLARKGGGT